MEYKFLEIELLDRSELLGTFQLFCDGKDIRLFCLLQHNGLFQFQLKFESALEGDYPKKKPTQLRNSIPHFFRRYLNAYTTTRMIPRGIIHIPKPFPNPKELSYIILFHFRV